MTTTSSIVYWNREKARYETEKVYGESFIKWLYETKSGLTLADHLLSKIFISQLYGMYQSSFLSRHKIKKFISDFEIKMDDYESDSFSSFNDFLFEVLKAEQDIFLKVPLLCRHFAKVAILDLRKHLAI